MPDMYNFIFKELQILSMHFELKTDKIYKNTKNILISSTLNLRHDIIKDDKHLRVFMKLDICGEDLPFSLNIEVGGLFVFSVKLKIGQPLEKIANINCAAIMFPYLRETVSDITRRANLPPLYLPPMNFVELYNNKLAGKKRKNSTAEINKKISHTKVNN
jgi:preprotein translocase subunit SecB